MNNVHSSIVTAHLQCLGGGGGDPTSENGYTTSGHLKIE